MPSPVLLMTRLFSMRAFVFSLPHTASAAPVGAVFITTLFFTTASQFLPSLSERPPDSGVALMFLPPFAMRLMNVCPSSL